MFQILTIKSHEKNGNVPKGGEGSAPTATHVCVAIILGQTWLEADKIWNIFSFDICSDYNSLVHGSSQVCYSWTAVWLLSTNIEMWDWSY